eukprot:CAMPEP_0114238632 /NCGR_PEP_ID=MMETSP0058-20121206/8025_1 /TAXON_ID=36894 /ORGANISM="Pyramimonas parkeae, CCMP726" /LENGTH=696 /DNA_ID=CAMNT_0001350749 /DNA_START=193 /DNA_END=2284 /DNA_ORIENTATION=-
MTSGENLSLIPRSSQDDEETEESEFYDKATWYCLVFCLILTSFGAVYTLVGAVTNVVKELEPPRSNGKIIVHTFLERSEGTGGGRSTRSIQTFKGIPYTEDPPTGANRFLSSTLISTPWEHVKDAREFKPPCMQSLHRSAASGAGAALDRASMPHPSYGGVRAGEASLAPAEDCLYLNVWTPGVANLATGTAAGESLNKHLKPVMFFVHGGELRMGAPSQPMFDGASLAASADVVVVSASYRLGPLGFLPTSNVTSEGTGTGGLNGVNDIVVALQWVRGQIVAFGGRPNQVTLFGTGAGSFAACVLMVSPLAAGLFDAVILESGTCTGSLTGVQSMETGMLVSGWFMSSLNVTTIQELQSMDADLLDFNPYLLNSALGLHIDAPTAYVDGWVLPNHPSQRIQAGQVNVKRVIVGANSMDSPLARRSWLNHRRHDTETEGGVSSVVNNEGTTKLYPDAPKPPLNQEEYEYAVGNYTARLCENSQLSIDADDLANQILEHYPMSNYSFAGDAAAAFAFFQMDADSHIVCAAQQLAQMLGNVSVETYHYSFGYGPTGVDPAAGWVLHGMNDQDDSEHWASHGAEIPFVFHNECTHCASDTGPCLVDSLAAQCIKPSEGWSDKMDAISLGIIQLWTSLINKDGPPTQNAVDTSDRGESDTWIPANPQVFKSVPTLVIDDGFELHYQFRDELCQFWQSVLG